MRRIVRRKGGAATCGSQFSWAGWIVGLGLAWWAASSQASEVEHAASASVSVPASQDWVARNWQTEDGLPQNTVNALVQTHDGFLWVGTGGGLARFDGYRFRNFALQDGLRSLRIAALAESRDGKLWIGTSGGGVSCWDGGKFTTYEQKEGFPSGGDVVCMTAGGNDAVWIGTSEGLVRWQQGRFELIGPEHGLPRDQIRAVAEDFRGVMWVSVIEAGLFENSTGRFVKVPGPGPVSGDCYSLLADREGGVWAGMGNGCMWEMRDGSWKKLDTRDGLPFSSFECLAQSGDGTIWTGVRKGGVYCLKGGRFEPEMEQRLGSSHVRSLLVDQDGSIWAGTSFGGLYRLSRRVLNFWGAEAGLAQAGTITSIVEEPSPSSAWLVCASGDGILRFENGRFEKLTDEVIGPFRPHAYAGMVAGDGSAWFSGEQFVCRVQTGQPTVLHRAPPVQNEAVRAVAALGNTVWLGTYYATLLRWDGREFQVSAPRGTFRGGITCLVPEDVGTLWVGSASGVYRWQADSLRKWGRVEGLVSGNVRALHRDPDGTVWIGTLGGGLSRLREGRVVNYTMREGLVDDVVSQILPDDHGAVWLGCNRGIMRIDRRDFDALDAGSITELHPVVFGKNEGVLSPQCASGCSPSAMKTRDGRLLFPTVGGIAEFHPQRLQAMSMTQPRVVVESVLVDGMPQALGDALVLSAGQHRLEISYTAPALSGGEWIRFRHRLEGLDTGWVKAGNRRQVSYGGLAPGRYVFHVGASDSRSNWSDAAASLAITVRPQPWESWWFRAGGMVLLVAVGGAAGLGIMNARHRRELAEMERTRQMRAELAHMSRVSLLGELSASLAHELKQPLTTILANSQAAMRFLTTEPVEIEEVRHSLEDITAADRRANEIIERMRNMVKKGEAEMESRDINADIEQALLLINNDLIERKVSIETRFSSEVLLVKGDHIQLQQVLLNLILNGCDAMAANPPEIRQLVVETRPADPGFILVAVSDRGPGLAPEMAERIFKPFFSTKMQGLGMGLSICKAIVGAHGGRLWAGNHSEGGATFSFTLRTVEE